MEFVAISREEGTAEKYYSPPHFSVWQAAVDYTERYQYAQGVLDLAVM